MKKLYRKSTSAVHPVSDYLPAAILTLAAALSPEDKEVLAYLISCSCSGSKNKNNNNTQKEKTKDYHAPVFSCDCFGCYMSYWVKWDTSQNRDLIHDIIEKYEDGLVNNNTPNKTSTSKRDRRKRKGRAVNHSTREVVTQLPESVGETSTNGGLELVVYGDGVAKEETIIEKGSMRKFVTFLGEKFWGVWT